MPTCPKRAANSKRRLILAFNSNFRTAQTADLTHNDSRLCKPITMNRGAYMLPAARGWPARYRTDADVPQLRR